MNEIVKGYILGLVYVFACLVVSLLLYKLHLPKKYTRKVAHILIGFEWVILYHYLGAGVHFLAICLFFLAVLIVAYKGNLMPMIASDSDNAPGTVYYAVAMSGVAIVGCFLPQVMLPFGVGILATSVGDGLAGVVGQLISHHNPKVYKNKSLFGCLANLVFTTLGAFILSQIYSIGLEFWHCLLIGFVAVELEAVTGFGLDNIVVTWGITALTYGFMYFEDIANYLVPIIVTPMIIAFASSRRALTNAGIAVAILMDIIVSAAFGNFGFVVLASFFVGSIIIDKIKKKARQNAHIEAKGSHRDAVQVIANGAVGTTCAIVFVFTKDVPWLVGFICAFAEAFSDTVASGLGAFAKRTYDIFRLRPATKGISGGISIVGTLSSLAGAFLISALAFCFLPAADALPVFLICGACAFLGAFLDSFFGSVLQVKYRCTVCGSLTERRSHCANPTTRHSGISWIDNDVVNILGGLCAAALAVILSFILL